MPHTTTSDAPALHGASAQPLVWQIRAGPGHMSWQNEDPYTFATTLRAEGDRNEIAHFLGGIGFGPGSMETLRAVLRLAADMGFEVATWDKLDPRTGKLRRVHLELLPKVDAASSSD